MNNFVVILSLIFLKPSSHSLLVGEQSITWRICLAMIGRANIEGSKSNIAIKARLPHASYLCGSFFHHGSKN